MITLQFKTQRELENFIVKVATPIAKKIAMEAVDSKLHFRAKVDVAAPSSALQVQQKSSGSLPLAGGVLTGPLTLAGVGFFAASPTNVKPTVSGSKGGNAALGSLLSVLSSLGLINDTTT